MTVWVDDIVFSSPRPFPKTWVSDIRKITGEVDLSLKAKKTKQYFAEEYKTVTGSAISPDGRITVKTKSEKRFLI